MPNFSKNLISSSKLDSNGYTYRASDRILKVIYDDRVIMKGKK